MNIVWAYGPPVDKKQAISVIRAAYGQDYLWPLLLLLKLLIVDTAYMDRLVAVMGATGRTGKHIVEKLLEKEIRVRILSRDLPKAKKMFGNI